MTNEVDKWYIPVLGNLIADFVDKSNQAEVADHLRWSGAQGYNLDVVVPAIPSRLFTEIINSHTIKPVLPIEYDYVRLWAVDNMVSLLWTSWNTNVMVLVSENRPHVLLMSVARNARTNDFFAAQWQISRACLLDVEYNIGTQPDSMAKWPKGLVMWSIDWREKRMSWATTARQTVNFFDWKGEPLSFPWQ